MEWVVGIVWNSHILFARHLDTMIHPNCTEFLERFINFVFSLIPAFGLGCTCCLSSDLARDARN